MVTIVFDDDMGTYLPRQLVQEKLTDIKDDIPKGFGKPFMAPIATGLGEIYQYSLVPKKGYEDKYSLTELRTIQCIVLHVDIRKKKKCQPMPVSSFINVKNVKPF